MNIKITDEHLKINSQQKETINIQHPHWTDIVPKTSPQPKHLQHRPCLENEIPSQLKRLNDRQEQVYLSR
jgi:hypothetical protein